MNLLEDKIDTGLMLLSVVFFCLSYFFPGHEFHLLIVSFCKNRGLILIEVSLIIVIFINFLCQSYYAQFLS